MEPRADRFTDLVKALDDADFKDLQQAVRERRCEERYGFATFEQAADLFRSEPSCPECGGRASKNGKTPKGRQRYLCTVCGNNYSALSDTVLEYSKKSLPDWVSFITLMCHNASLELISEMLEIAHSTAYEWRHRVFATVDGYQARIKLKDRIWIDEIYVSDTAILRGSDFTVKRGLSKQKICIAVAIDVHKNPVAVICGNGKPSSKRIKDALLEHIEEGSVIVHDMEKAHRSLVKAAKCTDEPYRADIKDPAYLKNMELINSLCSWIKRYLWRYTGMKSENLQSYLNWFVYLFRVKRDDERWPKVERVIRHLLMSNSYYRS
jgi:transposase-like protein